MNRVPGDMRNNITLPAEIGKKLKGIKNKSAFIAQSIREKLAKEDEVSFAKELRAAYTASAEESRQITQELDPVAGDGL